MVDTQSTCATRTCWHTFTKKEVNEYMLIQDTPKTMNSNEILYKSYNKTTKHGKDRSKEKNKSHGKKIHAFLQIMHLVRKNRTPSKDRECTHHILMNHDASDSTSIIGNNDDDDTPKENPR